MMDTTLPSGKMMREAPMDEIMEVLDWVTPNNYEMPQDLEEVAAQIYERIQIELVVRGLK